MRAEEELIERRRTAIRRVMEDRTARDIEYGYYHGAMEGVQCLKERKEQVEKLLSCDQRFCPPYGIVRYGGTTPNCLPLLHGPEGCAYWHKGLFLNAGAYLLMPMWPVVTTAMKERDVFFGGEDALRRAILKADAHYKPDLMIPVNTCVGAIIGDDIEGVCESVRGEVGCILAPATLPGFCSRNQIMGQDAFLTALCKYVMEEQREKVPNTINYVGESFGALRMQRPYVTDTDEIERVLKEMGVRVTCYLPGDGVEKIKRAPLAQLNVIRCMGSGLSFARTMKERFGTDYVATCVPLGIQPTTDFYMGIIEALGLGQSAIEVLKREIRETKEAMEPYRKVLEGKKFCLFAAAGRTPSLAFLFMELGMEPLGIGLHFMREKTFPNLEHLSIAAEERGYKPEIIVEPSLYETEAMVAALKPDIFFCDIHEKNIGMRLGIPSMEIMGLSPSGPMQGYRGVITLAQWAVATLENPLWSQKGPLVYRRPYSSQRYIEGERARRRRL